VIRDNLSRTSDGKYGRGIELVTDASIPPATLTLDGSVLGGNHDLALGIFNSTATVSTTVFQGTLAAPASGSGQGIAVQTDMGAATMASLTLEQCLVADNLVLGIAVDHATMSLDGVVVRGTKAGAGGLLGDGIAMLEPQDGTSISSSRIDTNERASVSMFSGSVTVSNARFACDTFDIDAEQNAAFAFDVSAPSSCGCSDPGGPCSVLSANLAPPGPITHGP